MRSRWLAGAIVAGLVFGACGDDDGGDGALPLVGEIAPAVDALERELGDAPQYYEIRATPLSVTLWVSADQGHRAIPYVWAGGELADAGGAQLVESGFTFASLDALDFDPDVILGQVADDLDTPLTQFSIVGTETGAPHYAVTAQSDQGGEIDIQLNAVGKPLEAVPID